MAKEPANARSDAERRFADLSRARFRAREARLERERHEREQRDAERARTVAVDPVAAALARALARKKSDP
jgi:hypothetical protein